MSWICAATEAAGGAHRQSHELVAMRKGCNHTGRADTKVSRSNASAEGVLFFVHGSGWFTSDRHDERASVKPRVLTSDGPPNSCGILPASGRCFDDVAVWCSSTDNVVQTRECVRPDVCGWSRADGGYRCVSSDPCNGITELGLCDDAGFEYCNAGLPSVVDCSACGQVCSINSASGRAYCHESSTLN
jgi:hypothetical protein